MRSNQPAERSKPGIRLVRDSDGRLQVESHNPSPKPKQGELAFTIPLPSFATLRKQVNSVVAKLALVHLKKHWIRYGAVAGVAIVVVAALLFATHRPHTITASTTGVKGASSAGLVRGTPSYSTLLPSGKSIDSLGGWYRVSPSNSDPVYAFADRIGSVQLDVSEQPLPGSFTQNTAEQIAQLAQSFSANEKIVAGDTIFYVGTSAKGPQSVILTKSDLLILIKSDSIIPNDQWAAYISALH